MPRIGVGSEWVWSRGKAVKWGDLGGIWLIPVIRRVTCHYCLPETSWADFTKFLGVSLWVRIYLPRDLLPSNEEVGVSVTGKVYTGAGIGGTHDFELALKSEKARVLMATAYWIPTMCQTLHQLFIAFPFTPNITTTPWNIYWASTMCQIFPTCFTRITLFSPYNGID